MSSFYWPNDTTYVATKDKIIKELKSLLSFYMFTYFQGCHGKHLPQIHTIDKHLNNMFLRSTSAERCYRTED